MYCLQEDYCTLPCQAVLETCGMLCRACVRPPGNHTISDTQAKEEDALLAILLYEESLLGRLGECMYCSNVTRASTPEVGIPQ